MSRFGIFRVNGVDYDLDDLDLDEVEELEQRSGAVMSEINFGSARAMKAVAFVLLRRSNPDLDFAEVGKVKLIDFLPADEEMPKLPPSDPEAPPNDSEPAASGHLHSVGSIPG